MHAHTNKLTNDATDLSMRVNKNPNNLHQVTRILHVLDLQIKNQSIHILAYALS